MAICWLTGCSVRSIRKFLCGVSGVSIFMAQSLSSSLLVRYRQLLQCEDLTVIYRDTHTHTRRCLDKHFCAFQHPWKEMKVATLTCSLLLQVLGSLLWASWGNSWKRQARQAPPTPTWSRRRTHLRRRPAGKKREGRTRVVMFLRNLHLFSKLRSLMGFFDNLGTQQSRIMTYYHPVKLLWWTCWQTFAYLHIQWI